MQELTQGLLYLSEGDYPVEVVQCNTLSAKELTQEEVLTLVNLPSDEPVVIRNLPYFFRNVTKPVKGEEAIDSPSKRFQALEAFLKEQLPVAKVYRIGKRHVRLYVLEKLEDAIYVGVKTTVVESH